jgi:gliding motility-associated-like protein
MHYIIKNTLRGCFLAAALWLFSDLSAVASHLMGGEVKYTYLGALGTGTNKYRYKITYNLYVNCDPSTSQIPDGRPNACVDLYNKTTNAYITTASFVKGASVVLPSLVSPSCNIPGLQNICVRYITYEGTVDLPFSAAGYYALTDDATRNNSIMNIQSPGGVGQSIYTEMAPFNLNNSSPQFLQQALAVICLGDTVDFSNGAFDAEGDQLVYTLTQPLSDISGTQGPNCQPGPATWFVPASVPYNPGYSYLQPFGTGSFMSINSTNGDTKIFIPNSGQGDYVIALQVQEYRTTSAGSTLIGTTRRELQILARPCPPNPAPVVTTQIPGGGSVINVVAGNPVNFSVQFKDTTSQTVTPSTTLSGNFTGLPNQPVFSTVSGSGTFTRAFSWTPTCSQAGNYSVIVTGTDNGCPAQPSQKTVTINVTPFKGVSIAGISGPTGVCPNTTTGTYTAPSRVGSNPVVWTVVGGTIASGQNTGTITVNWTPGSTVRTITAVETSNKGCTDSTTLQVSVVNPLNPVLSAASDTICSGASTVISGPGISNGTFTYTVTPGGVTLPANTVNPVFNAPSTLTAITTYTITVSAVDTSQQACISASQPIQITVIPNNIAKAGPDLSGCSGGTLAALGSTLNPIAGFTYSWSGTSAFPGFPTNDPRPTNITLPLNNGTTPVTYPLTLTATSKNGCISTDQVVVTVNPLPPVTLAAAATACSGGTFQLTAAGATIYTWTVTPALPGTITGTNPTVTFPTVTVPTTYTFSVTGTLNTTGCTKTAQTTVIVNPLPTVAAGVDLAHCVGQSSTFTASGAATYNWTVSPALPGFPQTGASISVNPSTPGTYTLTATGTASTGCVNSDQVVLTVNPLPTISGTDQTICLGETVTLTGSGAGIGGSYSWNTPGNPTGSTISFTPTAAGTFTYTVTGTNSNGCTNADASVTVTVNPLPVISAVSAAPSVCSGSSAQLTASGAGANGTYTWTQLSGPTATITSPALATTTVSFTNVLTAQTAVFQVTGIASTGCDSTATVSVIVNPLPVVASNGLSVCLGQTVNLSATGAGTGATYSWTTPGTPSGQNISFTPTAVGTFTYTVTGTNGNGCVDQDTVIITVKALPVINAGANQSVCLGKAVTLTATGAGIGGSYIWNTPGNPSGATVTFTPASLGTFTYTVVGAATTGCDSSDQIVITVTPLPVISAVAAAPTVCSESSAELTASGAGAGGSYIWTQVSGPSGAISQPTQAFTEVAFTNVTTTQTAVFQVTGTNSAGCDSTATISVIVNPLPVVTSNGFAVCLGQTVNLSATGAGAGATYSWTTPGAPSGPNVSFTPTAVGTFTYTVTGTNGNGCVDQDTVIVTVRALPVIDAGANQAVCIGQAVTLNATGAGAGGTYSWNIPGNPSGASVTFTPAAVGTFTYTVVGAATSGCDSSDQVVVTVNPLPAALAGNDSSVCEGATITLGGNQSGATYTWTASQGPQPANVANPTVTLPVAGTVQYIVTATSASNCVNTDTVTITVNPNPVTSPITGFAAVCPGLQNVPYSVVAGPAGSNYVWSVTGGTIANGQGTATVEINWGGIGNGMVSVYTESASGCPSVTVTFPVSINPTLPTPAPSGTTTLCSKSATASYAVYPQSPPGSVFNWTVLDGSGNSIPFSGGNTNNISVAWPGPGTYSLQVTENSTTNLAFCQGSSATVNVTVNPSPDSTLAIQGSTNPCVSATNLTYSLAGLPNSTYDWTLDGFTVTGSTGSQVIFPTLALGVHTLTVLETSDQGCVGKPITISVNVTSLPITPVVAGPAALCENSFTNLTYSVPANAGSTYAWTLPAGATVVGPSDQSTITISFAAFPTSAQTISVVETNATGCTSLAGTFQINPDVVAAQVLAVGTKETDEAIVVVDVTLPNLGTSANTPVDLYRSTFGNPAAPTVVAVLSAGATLQFVDDQVSTKTESYLYQVKALNACGDTIFSTVHQTILLNQSTQSDKGETTLTWNAYNTFDSGVKEYEIYRKADAGNFELVETTTSTAVTLKTGDAGFNQCFRIKAISNDSPALVSWSNSQCTSFENPIMVYNVITPNGDSKNDVFYVDHIELYPNNRLVILNRWGQEMHSTTNYKNDWSPKELADGTYFYQLTLQDGKTYTGWVSIIK